MNRSDTDVHVVGYFGSTSGLARLAHALATAVAADGFAVHRWDIPAGGGASDGEAAGSAAPVVRPGVRVITIAVVTAIDLPSVRERVPWPFAAAEVTVGVFLWELAQVPGEQRWGMALVDEIWAPTRFVRDAYRKATERTVRLVPLPIPEPTGVVAGRTLLDDGVGDDCAFLVSFDFLSSMERKNPAGAIEAFRRAFPRGDEPARLIVKTINGGRRANDLALLRDMAAGDARIRVWDEIVGADVLAGLLSAADVFVSLHRSEGLGLHIAESMWLGTPVIATDYSGSVDLTEPDPAGEPVCELIDAQLVPLVGGGEAYQAGVWAEPDLDQAAEAMRRLASDPARRDELAARARVRMQTRFDAGELASAIDGLTSRPPARRGRAGTSVLPMLSLAKRAVRRITAPVRDFFNQHFEMVKDEVRRTSAADAGAGGDVAAWRRVAALENGLAEQALFQARVLNRLTDEVDELVERIDDLERTVRQLAEVVAADTTRTG